MSIREAHKRWGVSTTAGLSGSYEFKYQAREAAKSLGFGVSSITCHCEFCEAEETAAEENSVQLGGGPPRIREELNGGSFGPVMREAFRDAAHQEYAPLFPPSIRELLAGRCVLRKLPEFLDGRGLYWCPEGKGYTDDIAEAGHWTVDQLPINFDKAEAVSILSLLEWVPPLPGIEAARWRELVGARDGCSLAELARRFGYTQGEIGAAFRRHGLTKSPKSRS